jgi:hypothetical protein
MLKTPIARGVALATLGATLAMPSMVQAAFIEVPKAGLEPQTLKIAKQKNGPKASSFALSPALPKVP